MKIGQVKSLLHDLIELENYKNPLNNVWIKKKIVFDLLTGEYSGEEDSFKELYGEKRTWFLDRIKKLNGNLGDFEEIKFTVFGAKEKLIIRYKGKNFEKEVVYEGWIDLQNKMRKEMKKTDVFDMETKKWIKRGDN